MRAIFGVVVAMSFCVLAACAGAYVASDAGASQARSVQSSR
jgi:hypothetical protein